MSVNGRGLVAHFRLVVIIQNTVDIENFWLVAMERVITVANEVVRRIQFGPIFDGEEEVRVYNFFCPVLYLKSTYT